MTSAIVPSVTLLGLLEGVPTAAAFELRGNGGAIPLLAEEEEFVADARPGRRRQEGAVPAARQATRADDFGLLEEAAAA
jgi:hypothetical protein